MAKNLEEYRGTLEHVLPQMQHEHAPAGVVSLVDTNDQNESKQVIMVTGLAAPERYMNRMGKKLRRSGHETHHLKHFIPANIVYRVERSIEEKMDRVAQSTGKSPDAVGYSLGGMMLARVKAKNPEFADGKLVTIGSPVSPLLGIDLPEQTYAESIFTPLDTVVPWPMSVNPDFAKHHAVLVSTHFGIVHRHDVSEIVNKALTGVDGDQHGTEIRGNILTLHNQLPTRNDIFNGAVKAASVIPLFDRIAHPAVRSISHTKAA